MTVHGISTGGMSLIVVSVVFLVIATAMIGLRFSARIQTRTVGFDDYVSLVSYIFLIGVTVCHILIGGPYGYCGWPSAELSPQQMKQFLIALYTDNINYALCTSFVKMSIVCLYRRIFITRLFKHITTVLLAVFSTWCIIVVCLQIFSCKPVQSSWIPTEAESCIHTTQFYNAVTISNVVFDFTLLLLPIPMVWQLQMNTKRKMQVCGVFALGAFTCICSILRTVMLQQLQTSDTTGTIWYAGIWTYIECAIGISCACIPPMAHHFKKLRRSKPATGFDSYGNALSDQSAGLSGLRPGGETTTSITGPKAQGKEYFELESLHD